jgi:hypothetical protein
VRNESQGLFFGISRGCPKEAREHISRDIYLHKRQDPRHVISSYARRYTRVCVILLPHLFSLSRSLFRMVDPIFFLFFPSSEASRREKRDLFRSVNASSRKTRDGSSEPRASWISNESDRHVARKCGIANYRLVNEPRRRRTSSSVVPTPIRVARQDPACFGHRCQ